MAVMPKEVQDAFNQMKNIVLATATPDGVPNADPMGMKKVIDAETVYISDQFFNKTLANLKENQKVAITFWGDEAPTRFTARLPTSTRVSSSRN